MAAGALVLGCNCYALATPRLLQEAHAAQKLLEPKVRTQGGELGATLKVGNSL